MDSKTIFASLALSRIHIIPRHDIPAIFSEHRENQHQDVGDVRIFFNHDLLKQFLPDQTKISFAWAYLVAGEILSPHAHPHATMIIVVQGNGKLIGQIQKPIASGDTILIPAHCSYGFTDISTEGLHAVTIHFNDHSTPPLPSTYPPTFNGLLAHNQQRLTQLLKNSFFHMLRDHTLDDPHKRQTFLDCLQLFGDLFQMLMFNRQATSVEEPYQTMFTAHFLEELGHNEFLAAREVKNKINDPILKAVSSWFTYQMFVLDNLEKAVIVHLVLETSGYYYHSLVQERMRDHVKSNYYQLHTENDEQHTEMALKLLRNHHPHIYKRLLQILDEGWDMLTAMNERVVTLVTAT